MKITESYLKKIINEEIHLKENKIFSILTNKTLSKLLTLVNSNVDKFFDLEKKFNLSKYSSNDEYKLYIEELSKKLSEIAGLVIKKPYKEDEMQEVIDNCNIALSLVNKFRSIRTLKLQVNNLSQSLNSMINLLYY